MQPWCWAPMPPTFQHPTPAHSRSIALLCHNKSLDACCVARGCSWHRCPRMEQQCDILDRSPRRQSAAPIPVERITDDLQQHDNSMISLFDAFGARNTRPTHRPMVHPCPWRSTAQQLAPKADSYRYQRSGAAGNASTAVASMMPHHASSLPGPPPLPAHHSHHPSTLPLSHRHTHTAKC